MKRAIAFCLSAIFLLSAMKTIAFANEYPGVVETQEQCDVKRVEVVNNCINYFEKGGGVTINAVIINDMIDFNLCYDNEPTTLYHATVPIANYTGNFADTATWKAIVNDAKRSMTAQKNAIMISREESATFATTAETRDVTINELFLAELEKVYGEGNTVRTVGSAQIGEKGEYLATIKEYYDPYVTYVMQKVTPRQMGLQALATLLGISSKVVVQLIGAGISLIPAESKFHIYYCVAFYEKVGIVDGKSYYRGYHKIQHIGILDPENLYSHMVVMDETPYYEFYDPSESVYETNYLFFGQIWLAYKNKHDL